MTKKRIFSEAFRLGVLGGGQLGKMLALAAGNWHLNLHLLDRHRDFPAGPFSPHFAEGDFAGYEDVLRFGSRMDVLTIEIEHVNSEALHALVSQGVTVHPHPRALDIIKDKGRQKQFYRENDIPTAPFELYPDETAVRHALTDETLAYPFVQKSRTAGYDGRGVAVIEDATQLDTKLLTGPCVIENRIDIEKELAVIVARNENGQVAAFPAVEMVFNPHANLVEFLQCPADIDSDIAHQAEQLARRAVAAYDLCGLLAVELFLTRSGELLINEVAPRPHNSGHHTIDSCYTSQFEQHLRAILNLPLGSTELKTAAVMVNLLGEPGHTGPAQYEGLAEVLALPGVNVHLYGKSETRPYRKMGHVTVIDREVERAAERARQVKELLKVTAA